MSQIIRMLLMLAVCACAAYAQTAPPPASAQATPPSPGDIYKQAMRPLDQVRASLDNWSDAELSALAVAMHKANEACAQMKPEDYSGDDLYDLAHLCAFGQSWENANTAAVQYIARGEKTHRAQAYALSTNALMQMKAVDMAIKTAQDMFQGLPYDAEVAFTMRYMKDTLEQDGNPAALQLASEEHAKIVQALQQGVPLKATYGDAVMDIGSLYDSAMEMAFLTSYNGATDAAAASAIAAECDSALPANAALTPEDTQRIASVRTRFHLLGTHLPKLTITRALLTPTAKPQLSQSFGAGTVLVLFPDWCVQCRKMTKTLTEFARVNATTSLYAYGLTFADISLIADMAAHDVFLKEMQGTSTFIVPATTVQTFGAQEFPLAIVVDGAGIIRFLETIPADAFKGDGYMEKVIKRMTSVNN